jgi:isoleucyl-tRNA synthetase
MIAPITPFISEEIYQNLTNEVSVHLSDFPKYDESLINEELEKQMDLVRDLISLGRNVREESKIKVRQPISEILLDKRNKDILKELDSLIIEELNVKNINYVSDLSTYMNFTVKPNFKEVGKLFGKNIKEYTTKLLELTNEEIVKLQNNESIKMTIDNVEYDITNSMVDIRIESKEGFNVGMANNEFVILNVELTEELLNEGLARETVSKIQQLRKNNNFEVSDKINVYFNADEEYFNKINNYLDYIKSETLCNEFTKKEDLNKEIDINDYKVGFELERI